ncbi:mesoderm posterior protein 1-like [Amblyraja radiata]|uniref:mesoderm posterior protein 1-like n=1 Tax=Amblyraja radiata TaxID=386614 RepID=UPI001401BD15|nr:mesoderm posterior protein 1-like [Amblyraja radiata]
MEVATQAVLAQRYVTSSGFGAALDCSSLCSGNGWNSTSSETNRSSDSSVSPIASPRCAPGDPCQAKGRPEEKGESGQQARKSRSRHLGRERQSASEREKLRMRGLAKALHNLRTYLPPSVAPAAQSLTKLETLRLTIRYIAHLTDVLALGEQMPTVGGGPCRAGGPQGWCPNAQGPPAQCPVYLGGTAVNGASELAAAFQDIGRGQSFTENNANLQLVPWFPWQH